MIKMFIFWGKSSQFIFIMFIGVFDVLYYFIFITYRSENYLNL